MLAERQFSLKHFSELSTTELYRILQLRGEVFVVEQKCNYQDLDNKDLVAHHFFLMNEQECLACCRLLAKGVSYTDYCSIGRVVSSPRVRGQAVGKQMMTQAIEEIKKLYPGTPIKISAQAYLQKFYESFGFVWTGEAYLEDDIPHLGMTIKY
ncbi:MAG: GNAT family N-acetyltransferase [Saprospiraceae bacterium]|nr:GNAT family N-acetyltransferase [Saprospiraceae bacterium]